MNIRSKTLIALIAFGLVDVVIPIPILCIILIYVVLQRPPWFTDLVQDVYKN